MARIGRRTRRISDRYTPRPRSRRFIDEDDISDDEDVDVEAEETVEVGDIKLTPEEIQGLLELLPYKEALIKIAKGEFEIEKVEEAEEEVAEEPEAEGTTTEEAESEGFEEDEDFAEDETEDEEDYFDEEDETENVEDSAVKSNIDAWKKRLSGGKN